MKLLIFGILLVSMVGCVQGPAVLNFKGQPVSSSGTGESHQLSEVSKIIMSACAKKKWVPQKISDGEIHASINIRAKHSAKVRIVYDTLNYNIDYLDSSGLEYKNGHIHRKYNQWVANLNQAIAKEFNASLLTP